MYGIACKLPSKLATNDIRRLGQTSDIIEHWPIGRRQRPWPDDLTYSLRGDRSKLSTGDERNRRTYDDNTNKASVCGAASEKQPLTGALQSLHHALLTKMQLHTVLVNPLIDPASETSQT